MPGIEPITPAAGGEYRPPPEIALERLRTRIEADDDLGEPYRSAILNDLSGARPGNLAALRALLNHPAPDDPTD